MFCWCCDAFANGFWSENLNFLEKLPRYSRFALKCIGFLFELERISGLRFEISSNLQHGPWLRDLEAFHMHWRSRSLSWAQGCWLASLNIVMNTSWWVSFIMNLQSRKAPEGSTQRRTKLTWGHQFVHVWMGNQQFHGQERHQLDILDFSKDPSPERKRRRRSHCKRIYWSITTSISLAEPLLNK